MYAGFASIVVVLQLLTQTAATTKLVCYFTSWSQYRPGAGKFVPANMEPSLCTHLVYDFAIINHNSEITANLWNEKPLFQSFNDLKKRNSKLKTLLSVRQEDPNGTQFNNMLSTTVTRSKFIQSTIKFLRAHGFDGLGLYWPYSGCDARAAMDKEKFTLLCKELSEAYEAESQGHRNTRLILSVAVTPEPDTGSDISEMSKYLDFISVKTFDLHSTKDGVTGHHSALYSGTPGTENKMNINHVMQYWMKGGAPKEKLLLGFPVHARSFTLSTTATGLNAPVSGPSTPGPYTQETGIWSYYETCAFLAGTSVQWIESQKVPYAVKSNQWVGFDNQKSYDAKVDYLKNMRLGGAAVWTLDMDDFSGQFCGQGRYPLVSHLRNQLGLSEGKATQVHPSAIPPPTSPPSVLPQTTETTQKYRMTTHSSRPNPDNSCLPNITVMYPNNRFCSQRLDGLYRRSDNPKSFYSCVRRKTHVTKCYTTDREHSSGVQIIPSGKLILLSVVILLNLVCLWSNR